MVNVSIVVKMLVKDALPEDIYKSKMFICGMIVVKSSERMCCLPLYECILESLSEC